MIRLQTAYCLVMLYLGGCLAFLVGTVSMLGATVPTVLFGATPLAFAFKVDKWWAKQVGAPRGRMDKGNSAVPDGTACSSCQRWCLGSTELNEPCICGCRKHPQNR